MRSADRASTSCAEPASSGILSCAAGGSSATRAAQFALKRRRKRRASPRPRPTRSTRRVPSASSSIAARRSTSHSASSSRFSLGVQRQREAHQVGQHAQRHFAGEQLAAPAASASTPCGSGKRLLKPPGERRLHAARGLRLAVGGVHVVDQLDLGLAERPRRPAARERSAPRRMPSSMMLYRPSSSRWCVTTLPRQTCGSSGGRPS